MTATRDAWSLYSPTGYAMARTPLTVLIERPGPIGVVDYARRRDPPPVKRRQRGASFNACKASGDYLESIGSSRVDRGLRPNESTFRDACRSSRIIFESNSLLGPKR